MPGNSLWRKSLDGQRILFAGEHTGPGSTCPPQTIPAEGKRCENLSHHSWLSSASSPAAGSGEAITEVDDGPFGGVYSLRKVAEFPLPLYFWPYWYPGRGSVPGSLSTTMRSASLTIRPDGSFTWSTLVEESATSLESTLLQYVSWTVRRDAYGTWEYTPSTGVVLLEGLDQFGPYVLTGSTTNSVLTLSSTSTDRPNSKFVLER